MNKKKVLYGVAAACIMLVIGVVTVRYLVQGGIKGMSTAVEVGGFDFMYESESKKENQE